MLKNESKKQKVKRRKHDCILLTLSVDLAALPVRRGACSSWSPWRSMRLSATLLQGSIPVLREGGGRPEQACPISNPRDLFSQLCSEPAKFSPLVRRRVGVGATTRMMVMTTMLSHVSETSVKTCWCHTLCRHHHNKATITNNLAFRGFSGYQPWRDSLGKIKESRNY